MRSQFIELQRSAGKPLGLPVSQFPADKQSEGLSKGSRSGDFNPVATNDPAPRRACGHPSRPKKQFYQNEANFPEGQKSAKTLWVNEL